MQTTAKEELRHWMAAGGHQQVAVADAIGVSKVRLNRLIHGRGALSADELQRIEKLTEIPGVAARLAAEQPRHRKASERRSVRRAPAASEAVPGPLPEPSLLPPDFPEALPRLLAEESGKPQTEPLFREMVRLACSARTEGTRQRAVADLLDRALGRAVQRVLDTTKRPPAENAELLLVLRQLQEAPAAPAPAEQAQDPRKTEPPRGATNA